MQISWRVSAPGEKQAEAAGCPEASPNPPLGVLGSQLGGRCKVLGEATSECEHELTVKRPRAAASRDDAQPGAGRRVTHSACVYGTRALPQALLD